MPVENDQVSNPGNENQPSPNPTPTPNPNGEDPKGDEPKGSTGAVAFYKEQMAKQNKMIEKMQQENAELAKRIEESEFKTLQEKEQHKDLAEKYRQKWEAAEKEKKEYSNFYTMDKKMEVLKRVAIEKGIRKESIEDISLIDLDEVTIETTSSGRINVLGAEDAIDKLKASRPHWFQDSRPPIINNGNPVYNEGHQLTPAEILKMQKDNPAKYKEHMQKMIEKRLKRP